MLYFPHTLAAVSVTRYITLFISDFQYPAGPSKPYLSAHTNLSGCKVSHNKEHLPSTLVLKADTRHEAQSRHNSSEHLASPNLRNPTS